MKKILKNILYLFFICSFLFSCSCSSGGHYDSSYEDKLKELDLISLFLNKSEDEIYKIQVKNEEYNDNEYYKDASNEIYNLMSKMNFELIDINDYRGGQYINEFTIIYRTNDCKYKCYLYNKDDLYATAISYNIIYNSYSYSTTKYYKITFENYQNILNKALLITSNCFCEV